MPGRIIKVFVREGEKVKEGQAVLVLEAMKMQDEIKSHSLQIVYQEPLEISNISVYPLKLNDNFLKYKHD